MRACRLQQQVHGVRDGAPVPPPVQLAQLSEHRGDVAERGLQAGGDVADPAAPPGEIRAAPRRAARTADPAASQKRIARRRAIQSPTMPPAAPPPLRAGGTTSIPSACAECRVLPAPAHRVATRPGGSGRIAGTGSRCAVAGPVTVRRTPPPGALSTRSVSPAIPRNPPPFPAGTRRSRSWRRIASCMDAGEEARSPAGWPGNRGSVLFERGIFRLPRCLVPSHLSARTPRSRNPEAASPSGSFWSTGTKPVPRATSESRTSR